MPVHEPGKCDRDMEHLIEARNLVKVYKSASGEFSALKGVNFYVDKSEFIAIVGKSGSGKSTLLNMISGIDRPTSGELYIDSCALHLMSEEEITAWRGRRMGIVFQFFQLLPTLTVIENIMLPMDFCHTYPSNRRKSRARDLLERVGLSEHANKLPTALSGGQQQRVAIARALANDPPIIMADEPTGNLDSQTAESVFGLFEALIREGKTIIMVTHSSELAGRATRTITISDGRIVDAVPQSSPTTNSAMVLLSAFF